MKLSRAKLESLVEDLVDKTLRPCRTALQDAGLNVGEIDDVILVGGQTRMPLVQKKAKDFFNKEARKDVNPDEAVAIGAAIQAAVLAGDVKDVLLLDVTPLSLGIETLGRVMRLADRKEYDHPHQKNPGVLHGGRQPDGGHHPRLAGRTQTGGAEQIAGAVRSTGHSAGRRAGMPQIEVSFDLDANGILNVSA